MPDKVSLMDASRTDWFADLPPGSSYPGDENIKIGCMQRIANATEAMAVNFVRMQAELKSMTDQRDNWRRWHDTMERRNRSYKGQVTKLKKQLAAKK